MVKQYQMTCLSRGCTFAQWRLDTSIRLLRYSSINQWPNEVFDNFDRFLHPVTIPFEETLFARYQHGQLERLELAATRKL